MLPKHAPKPQSEIVETQVKRFDISITAQGRLVKVGTKIKGLDQPSPPSQRGLVTGFSRKSRKRLLELFNSVESRAIEDVKPIFLTLTYGQDWPDPHAAKQHLRALLEVLRRAHPKASAVWRIEFQKRGAPHFHLMIFNIRFWPIWEIRRAWLRIVGTQYADNSAGEPRCPNVDIKRIVSYRQMIYYVSKYVAKDNDLGTGAKCRFSGVPYSHVGRHWGIHNKAFMPMDFVAKVTIKGFRNFIHYLREAGLVYYDKLYTGDRFEGFTLFTDDAYKFVENALDQLRQLDIRQHSVETLTA